MLRTIARLAVYGFLAGAVVGFIAALLGYPITPETIAGWLAYVSV